MDRGFIIPSTGVRHTMGTGVKTPWVEGSIYYGDGFQNTIGRGFDIPW